MRKKSHYIERKAARSLMHAARTAFAIGKPFNMAVTLNYWQLGFDIESAVIAFEKMRNQNFSSWSRYMVQSSNGELAPRNGPKTYAYAFEAPDGKVHVHWLVHISKGNKSGFRKLIRRAVCRAAEIDDLGRALLFQNTAETKDAEAVKLYMGKGIEPHYAKEFCDIEPEECGIIYGRRCNVSRNLGPSVYLPLRDEYHAKNPGKRRRRRQPFHRQKAG